MDPVTVLLSEMISEQKEEEQQSLSSVLELRSFSSEGERVRRLMEFSVLLCKRCTLWEGLLLTGNGIYSMTLLKGILGSRLESPKETKMLRGD